jgi:hypothetical protein
MSVVRKQPKVNLGPPPPPDVRWGRLVPRAIAFLSGREIERVMVMLLSQYPSDLPKCRLRNKFCPPPRLAFVHIIPEEDERHELVLKGTNDRPNKEID